MSVVISDAWRQRFGGTARLYGEKALQCFADAHVCVVGIGGVGSWAAEALARTGIGAITLIDMDDVCVTNTNRQIHALSGNVGLAKAEVMAERIRLINPECRVTVVDDFVTPENVAEYLGAGFSYVIDAIDSVRPKAALIAWCRRYKVPLVTTGGAGGQIDPTQILYGSAGLPAGGRQCLRDEEHGGRTEADGLRIRVWRRDDGDRDLWFCRRLPCAEENAGEGGAADDVNSRVAAQAPYPVYRTIPRRRRCAPVRATKLHEPVARARRVKRRPRDELKPQPRGRRRAPPRSGR